MKVSVCALLFLLVAAGSSAHPGVGIVMDRQGNVYYTDLVHVWRIAPSGQKSIAVADVHSHELAIDSVGNLYGEDSRYEGSERYRHRIWRRSPDGSVTDVVPWRDGFWREYGFTRDRAGAMYWVQCPESACTIYKRTLEGRTTTVAAGAPFEHPINWIAATPDGSLYVADGPDLRRIDARGRLTTLAGRLSREGGRHALMGLWPGAGGSVYVAVYADRKVVHVSAEGRVTEVARSEAPWSPSGVLIAPDDALWVLEYSASNEARVRRISPDGDVRTY